MRLSRRAFAGAIALALISGCVSVTRQGPGPALLQSLTVHNATSFGGTGKTYRLARGLDGRLGQSQYVDRAGSGRLLLPAALRGETFIRTADGDRAAAAGDTQFLEFEVAQSSTVYVAHDTRIRLKPRWLANNFMDTGLQLRVGSVAGGGRTCGTYPAPLHFEDSLMQSYTIQAFVRALKKEASSSP